MKIHNTCKQYFNGPSDLRHFRKNSHQKNLIASLKTVSYLFVPISLTVGIAYGLSTAYRYFQHKKKPITNSEQKTAVQQQKALPKSEVKTVVEPNRQPIHQTDLQSVSQTKTKQGIDTANVLNTPRGVASIAYPGDLNASEKFEIPTNVAANVPLVKNDDTHLDLRCKKSPDVRISIRRQNIFQSGAEVIVNAANDHLQGGGGIDGAVNAAGGAKYSALQRGLRSIPEYNAKFVTGHACMIDSGDIKSKYGIEHVIVVAGPNVNGVEAKDLSPYCTELYCCYYNSLMLAHHQGKKSIAFPAISTGIFGFPKDRAAEISLRAINDFLSQYSDTQLKNISIHFLPSDPESVVQDYRKIAV